MAKSREDRHVTRVSRTTKPDRRESKCRRGLKTRGPIVAAILGISGGLMWKGVDPAPSCWRYPGSWR